MRSAWNRGRLAVAMFPVLVALHPGSSARADDCSPKRGVSPCVDADNLWPHAGGGAYLAIGDASTTPAGRVAVGLVGSYLAQPLGVHVTSADPAGSTVYLVDQAFDATLLVALGVTDRLELTLAEPLTFYQSGAGLAEVDGAARAPLPSVFRDVRFGLAYAILERVTGSSRPALTARLEFGAPTGTSGNFAGGPTVVVVPSIVLSVRVGRVDLSAEASARLRGEAAFANAVVGPQIGAALGSSVDILRDRWLSAGAEAFALPTTSQQGVDPTTGSAAPLVPAEWIAHVSTAHLLGGDLVLSLGGGGSIPFTPHAAITSPRYRLDFAVRFAPRPRDAGASHPVTPGAHDPR